MNRPQLGHLVRAASAITCAEVVTVWGRAALHGEHPELPPELTESMVAEIGVTGPHEYDDLIDGTIGQSTAFHAMFGYYAHALSPLSRDAPHDWGWRTTLLATR